MKKFWIIVCIWIMLLCTVISSNAKSDISFQINYDSQNQDTYEVKNKINEIYRNLIDGLHKESYIMMVIHNKDQFAYKEDLQVDFKNHTLYIKEGDGKGDEITGSLRGNSVCVPEVAPRSFFAEMFD